MKSLSSFCAAFSCLLFCLLAMARTPQQASQRKSPLPAGKTAVEIREGEQLFRTHCGRCHNAPDDLSPREARAVVRQMRVRAMLSERDERRLLEFLAP